MEKSNVQWWKEACFYQIWPRSFKDGNNDGIGDLKGILEKLPYIKELGCDAIWFSPLYVSPQSDYGYDIADYRDIAPEYGTLDDFKAVLDAAHALGIKVIMDLVINHTSNKHRWFLESRKGGDDNPYKDYYIWRPGKGKDGKKKPNNWTATFPGEAWEFDEVRGEYYLHLFAVEQPDLNMDNPKVREEVKDIMRFWLDMGVDGFREDVITFISKREGLPNGFPIPAARGIEHYANGPHLHEYLKEFKEVWASYGAMTVGEAPMMTPKRALKFISEGENQELNMMFGFQHMEADCFLFSWLRRPFNLRKLKRVLNNWQTKLYGKAWNTLFIENHDQPRIVSRYGCDHEAYRALSAKALATMYLLLSGTPFIYQGQEIGMTNIGGEKLSDYADVNTFACYRLFRKLGFSHENVMAKAAYAARDNARTPVQWSAGKYAGFSKSEPWFRVNPNHKKVNVEDALNNENSILNYYKELIKYRKGNKTVLYGDFVLHDKFSKKLFVYERNYNGEKLLVAINFTKHDVPFAAPKGVDLNRGKLIISNYPHAESEPAVASLRPYEAVVYRFS